MEEYCHLFLGMWIWVKPIMNNTENRDGKHTGMRKEFKIITSFNLHTYCVTKKYGLATMRWALVENCILDILLTLKLNWL